MSIKATSLLLLGLMMLSSSFSAAYAEEVQCGSTTVSVEDVQRYEGNLVQVDLRDQSGKAIIPQIQAQGKFLSLCKFGVFALVDNDVHHRNGKSYLMRSDGAVLASFDFGGIFLVGVAPDHKYFWVSRFEEQTDGEVKLFTNMTVVDYRGTVVLKKRYSSAAKAKVTIDGAVYEVDVPEPDYP